MKTSINAMSEAHLLMAEHCRGRVDAVERRDSVEFSCRRAAGVESAVRVALAPQRVRRAL